MVTVPFRDMCTSHTRVLEHLQNLLHTVYSSYNVIASTDQAKDLNLVAVNMWLADHESNSWIGIKIWIGT